MLTKVEIFPQMEPELFQIVQQWNEEGILMEGQFKFARERVFQTAFPLVYEIIMEHGGQPVGNLYPHHVSAYMSSLLPTCSAMGIPNKGWMNFAFDPCRMSVSIARNKVRSYFISG